MREKIVMGIGLVIGSAILVGLYFLGFRITYDPKLENSWDAISAFGQWAGVAASMAIAYMLYKIERHKKPIIKLVTNIVEDDKLVLRIFNAGKATIVIKSISMNFKDCSVGRICCENNIGADLIFGYYLIKPDELEAITIPIGLIQSQLGEYYNRDEDVFYKDFVEEIGNSKLRIEVIDIENERFEIKTTYGFKEFYNIINGKG